MHCKMAQKKSIKGRLISVSLKNWKLFIWKALFDLWSTLKFMFLKYAICDKYQCVYLNEKCKIYVLHVCKYFGKAFSHIIITKMNFYLK